MHGWFPDFAKVSDLNELEKRLGQNLLEPDLLVVGAGINGSAIALDAASRGLKVCLVDKGDFGSGSSAGCFRIAHGGLRYLQHFDLPRLFESVLEQRLLRKNAHAYLKPLRFMVPCYGSGKKGKNYLGIGLYLYELLTFWRNMGVRSDQRLSGPGFLSAEEVIEEYPGIRKEGLSGAALFSDSQIINCDRMTFAVVKSAEKLGAGVFNYVQASNLVAEGTRLQSVQLEDVLTGQQVTIRPRYLVNAAGPWSRELGQSQAGKDKERVFSKGLQITFRGGASEGKYFSDKYAVALESSYVDPAAKAGRGGRSYFIVPWRKNILAGTADIEFKGMADDFDFSNKEVEKFISELEDVSGASNLRSKVVNSFGGLRAIDEEILQKNGEAVVARNHFISKAELPSGKSFDNVWNVEGVKYTTFRALAEKVVNEVVGEKVKSPTRALSLYGSKKCNLDKICSQLESYFSPDVSARIVSEYGSASEGIIEFAKLDDALVGSCPQLTVAELHYSFQEERCRTFADLILRRQTIFSEYGSQDSTLEEIAALVCKRQGLDKDEEIRNLKAEISRTNPL